MEAKVEATARLNEEASAAVRARRGAFNVSESGAGNFLARRSSSPTWRAGRVDIAAVPAPSCRPPSAALPAEEQRRCSPRPRKSARSCSGRSRRWRPSATPSSRRSSRQPAARPASLDQQLYDAVRAQAAPLGLEYENGPRF